MAEELNEGRAWLEYLAWTRGAVPDQYDATERLAWARLQRALHPIALDLDAPADPAGQWQRWSEDWPDPSNPSSPPFDAL